MKSLQPKSQVHYFTSNIEFRQLPINFNFVLSQCKPLRLSYLLLLTQFLQNYFFFLICKSGNEYIYITGLCAFIAMSGLTLGFGHKQSEVRSKTSLAFMGLLDIIYFLMLLGTGHYLTSFVFATQLQATLFIRVFLIKFILTSSFRLVHYIGALIILIATVLNFIFHGDKYTYLLLLGMFLHCINNIIKRHYLKKFLVDCLAMNKYVMVFATGFGVIITPLVGLLNSEPIGDNTVKNLMCFAGVSCSLMPMYLGLLILSALAHQAILTRTATERDSHRVVYMFSAITAFLGYYCAEATIRDTRLEINMIICAALAIMGGIVYHIHPEIPQKFSYSDI